MNFSAVLQSVNLVTVLPPGKYGSAEIDHDSPSGLDRIRGAMHGQPLNRNTCVRLLVDGHLLMSDTDDERRTNAAFCRKAHGDVLVAGLGIGLVLLPILDRRNVTSVTVVEKNPDVIALVAPRLAHSKLTVVEADILEWRTYRVFDTIYFDIWSNVSTDDMETVRKLEARFRRNLRPASRAWMGSWARELLLAHGYGG